MNELTLEQLLWHYDKCLSTMPKSHRMRLLSEMQAARSRWRVRPRKCSFDTCHANAIPRSHSLSRGMMLEPIAEDQHVYAPQVDLIKGSYDVKQVRVRAASTFPGFCSTHEKAFAFEQQRAVTTGEHLQMQLFRACCRHLFFLEEELAVASHCRQLLWDLAGSCLTSGLPSQDRTLVRLAQSEITSLIDLSVCQRSQDIEYIKKTWRSPLSNGFGSPLDDSLFWDELIQCTTQMPLAMSDRILFEDCTRDAEGTPDFGDSFFISVFPNNGHTLVHLASEATRRPQLVELARTFGDGAKLTAFVERTIVERSDHWFISPRCWTNLPQKVQESIVKRLNMPLWPQGLDWTAVS